jgi:DNA-binding CsgD family transcriptional regulator
MRALNVSYSPSRSSLLQSVLDNAEVGVAVVDSAGGTVYVNGSARRLLNTDTGVMPAWTEPLLAPLLSQVRASGSQALDKWVHEELVLRVRVRPLDGASELSVLEITVAHAGSTREVAETLSRGLQITITDARLLSLLWRGMSNEEIASSLNVRVGTVKSRLFRLYQKLGVKRRAAAVLRAAEVLG